MSSRARQAELSDGAHDIVVIASVTEAAPAAASSSPGPPMARGPPRRAGRCPTTAAMMSRPLTASASRNQALYGWPVASSSLGKLVATGNRDGPSDASRNAL